MSRLLETIKITEGYLQNISFHNQRMMRSVEVLFGVRKTIRMEDLILIPDDARSGIYKCRIEYDREIRKIEFQPYIIKPVRSLKLIECNDLEYSLKFTDRSRLEELLSGRGSCDDILVIKNGMVTDTSYSNVVFMDFQGNWITPLTYLLAGTRREGLLKSGTILESSVSWHDIHNYSKVKLINAMIGIDDTEGFPVENIV